MTDQVTKPTQISAKVLGQLAMPDACPRCFWIQNKCKPLPFQIFPGIFSTIDAYTRKIVHASFDQFGKAPAWLPSLKDAFRYWKVPHWSKFRRTDPETGIVLSGVPDGLFENTDGSLTIPDYKTAKFTDTQDKLFPMYEAQLNGYGWIQGGLTRAEVKSLVLIYFEPVTDAPADYQPIKPDTQWPLNKYTGDGFNMALKAYELLVKIDFDMITKLLGKAKVILDLTKPPAGLVGCKDCHNLDRLIFRLEHSE
jgi:hypothetical protein